MADKWWMRLLRPLLNEIGEVNLDSDDKSDESGGENKAGAEDDPFMTALSEVDIDPEDLKLEKEGEKEKKVESKETKPVLSETDLAALRFERDDLLRKNKDLNKALHEERQAKKTKLEGDKEAVLSDTDLAKIIAEHKDEPEVLLNAVNYKVQQAMKTGKKEAINEVEIKQKQSTLNGILKERYGDTLEDSSNPVRQTVDKVKDYLGLADHPYGEALSVAGAVFLNLPQLLNAQYQKGVKDAETGTIEKNRIASIESGKHGMKLGGSEGEEKKGKATLSESEMETAKRLGFKPGSPQWRIYQSQIRKSKAA